MSTASECGHDAYWRGQWGICMACRARDAEEAFSELQAEVERQRHALGLISMAVGNPAVEGTIGGGLEEGLANFIIERLKERDATIADHESCEVVMRKALETIATHGTGVNPLLLMSAVREVAAAALQSQPAPLTELEKAFDKEPERSIAEAALQRIAQPLPGWQCEHGTIQEPDTLRAKCGCWRDKQPAQSTAKLGGEPRE